MLVSGVGYQQALRACLLLSDSRARRGSSRKKGRSIGHDSTIGSNDAWPELVERCHDMSEADAEIVLGEGEALRYFDLRISPLYRRHGDLAVAGRLIVLTDITERKQAPRCRC